MRRRRLLAVTGCTVLIGGAGCVDGVQSLLPAEDEIEFTSPDEDQFPVDVEDAQRGGAKFHMTVQLDDAAEYEDGSWDCASQVFDAIRNDRFLLNHYEAEIGDPQMVTPGYGNQPGFDGTAILVTLITGRYDREGDLIEEADIELGDLVDVTPPTIHIVHNGKSVCAVPVYVDATKIQED